jgi:hypothetical protein
MTADYAPSVHVSPQSLSWANDQLAEAMSGAKSRFKELSSDPPHLREAQLALLLTTQRKLRAYKHAMDGKSANSFGWVNADPDLAVASNVLARHNVCNSDLSMLPEEFLGSNDSPAGPAPDQEFDLFGSVLAS